MGLFQPRFCASTAVVVAIVLAYASWPSSRLIPINTGDAVIVTGTSTGIGKHAALSLAKEGYVVFACVRKTKDGEALIQTAEKFDVDATKIKPIILDVTNAEHIANGVKTVASFVGERGLKGLFNNAGIGADSNGQKDSSAVEHLDMAQYRKVFDVNFFGLVEVTKAFLPLLRQGKGRVVMNASIAGFFAIPFMSIYASSKHAVEGFSDSLRRELYPHGVKVSVIEAGAVSTPILNGFIPKGIDPYAEMERSMWKISWKSAIGAPSPRVTSEAVLHAMRAENPSIRYVVGKDSGLVNLLRYLPFGWVDLLVQLMAKYGKEISDAELKFFLEDVTAEFSL